MKGRQYIRDGRAPIPDKEITSFKMSKIKGKDTKPEIVLRKALHKNGLKGYRLHLRISGCRPDILFIRRKVAVFVHGCFWHSCPICNLDIPAKHPEFWSEKLSKNVERDTNKESVLRNMGWEVVVCWECEVNKNIDACIFKIKLALDTHANK